MKPDFAPGQGWHRDGEGYRIPGCHNDLVDRARRAWIGVVLRIRGGGERIAAERLRNMEPLEGGVLMMPLLEGWRAHLFDLPNVTKPLLMLDDARIVREGPDFRQYAGLEQTGKDKWPQTWLCTRTREQLQDVLDRMVEREWR